MLATCVCGVVPVLLVCGRVGSALLGGCRFFGWSGFVLDIAASLRPAPLLVPVVVGPGGAGWGDVVRAGFNHPPPAVLDDGGRSLGGFRGWCLAWGGRGSTGAGVADVGDLFIAGFDDLLVVVGRPGQQRPAATGRARPFLRPGLLCPGPVHRVGPYHRSLHRLVAATAIARSLPESARPIDHRERSTGPRIRAR